jgi:hypothetical protein
MVTISTIISLEVIQVIDEQPHIFAQCRLMHCNMGHVTWQRMVRGVIPSHDFCLIVRNGYIRATHSSIRSITDLS